MRLSQLTAAAHQKRNQQIVDYQLANPDLSLKEIATVFNLTDGRIHQILVSAGIRLKRKYGKWSKRDDRGTATANAPHN